MYMTDQLAEKRRYFRVDDTISLLFRVVDESKIAAGSHLSHDILASCGLTAALEVLNQECAQLTPRLERRAPEVYEYLKLLDSKIQLIAQAVAAPKHEFSEHDKREVNLSASGLAFCNEQAIAEGTVLELRMLLTSCLAVIVVYARVMQCSADAEQNPDRPFRVCAEYININEEDRELLIKHVIKRQMQQLRDKHAQ